MTWKNRFMTLGLLAALLPAPAAIAADHRDGAAVLMDPATDINDVYSWMSTDGSKVYVAMTVFPAADKVNSKFSNVAYYVFHTTSRPSFFSPMGTVPVDIICSFDASAAQKITCWVGSDTNNFVYGDASNPAGISSANGKVTVFAGPRKDHFFFNLDGFNAFRQKVTADKMAITNPMFNDARGCPNNAAAFVPNTRAQLVSQLQQNPAGGAPTDFFKNLNAMVIVLQIDKTLLTASGPILNVWAGTYKKM